LDFPKRLALQLDRSAKLGVHYSWRRVARAAIELRDAPVPRSNAPGRLEKALGKRLESRPSGGHGAAKWQSE
jgi:hypothetical protein